MLIVIVEPSQFVLVEQVLDDAGGVDVAECQCIEALEFALFRGVARGCFRCIDCDIEWTDEHQILVPDAVFAAQVDGGLVREEHSIAQYLRVVFHTYRLWSFVHTQVVTYAVGCSMPIRLAVTPKVDASQRIQLVTSSAAREDGPCQTDMSLEHQGIVTLHLWTHLANANGAGDVGGAIQILTARIDEEQTVAGDWGVVLLRGLIMRHGSVLVPRNDCREGFFAIERLFPTEVYQLLHDVHLGECSLWAGCVVAQVTECLAIRKGVFQPMVETGQGDAVFKQCRFESFNLDRVLDALHEGNGIGADHFAIGALCSLFVGQDVNVQVRQVLVHLVGDLFFMNIKDRSLPVQKEIADEDGCAGDVGAAQIQDPGNLVERREPESLAALLLNSIEYTVDAVACLLATQFLGIELNLSHRQGRTVVPEHADQVDVHIHFDAEEDAAVATCPVGVVLSLVFIDPFVRCRHTSHLHLH